MTEADLASQQAIQALIESVYPSHRFLGEEDGLPADLAEKLAGYCWIVDPLDGTTNYVHHMPAFAVSVALCLHGEPVVGVVYDPSLDECFAAERGAGASLNGVRIQCSTETELRQSLLAASFSPSIPEESQEVDRFVRVLYECQALRRLGSAALNLAYVACGRLDGYWATSVKPWDVAAGCLLVAESGAEITDIGGGPFDLKDPKFLATSTPTLHMVLRRLLQTP